jgi:hypothetical protein
VKEEQLELEVGISKLIGKQQNVLKFLGLEYSSSVAIDKPCQPSRVQKASSIDALKCGLNAPQNQSINPLVTSNKEVLRTDEHSSKSIDFWSHISDQKLASF